jgi:hypothetical protein
MGDRNAYRNNTAGINLSKGVRFVIAERNFTILPTDLALNRTIGLGVLPKNFVVTGARLILSDIDTNGTPTHQCTIGDSFNNARYVAATTIGQTGGTTSTLAPAGDLFKIPDDNYELLLTTTVASATAVAGTGSIFIEGFVE